MRRNLPASASCSSRASMVSKLPSRFSVQVQICIALTSLNALIVVRIAVSSRSVSSRVAAITCSAP